MSKITQGKLFYEIEWDFITAMAERMLSNKHKYPRWSFRQDLEPEEIAQAIFRHTKEILQGKYEDDGRKYGNIEALACNAMILYYHVALKNKEIDMSIHEIASILNSVDPTFKTTEDLNYYKVNQTYLDQISNEMYRLTLEERQVLSTILNENGKIVLSKFFPYRAKP